MGAPKRPSGAALLRRMEAWGDEWRAVAGSTQPADRARAEDALCSLYAAAGKPAPAFAWVPSPAAGILAYTFASLGHPGVVSPWARGDIGSGDNREFNGLAAPFGLEPAWTVRLAASLRDRIPAERRPASAGLDPLDLAAEALGFGGTARSMPLLRAAASAGSQRQARPAAAAPGAGEPRSDDAIAAAESVLGDAWPGLAEALGRDLAGAVFVEATRRLVAQVLGAPLQRQNALQAMQPGQWDAVTPVLASARDVFGGSVWRHRAGRAEREAQVDARLELARSAGPWWALHGLAIVSERPLVLRRDDRGRPHRADGPAIAWADGLETHAWHGVAVEPWIVTDPGRITVEAIDAESNVEVRRVLVERFGEERLVREGGATLVDEDATGRLWRRPLKRVSWRAPDNEPVVMVEVVNSTPEPDGSRKTYFLRVPPTVKTAREAVAWTFGLGAVEYRPAMET